MILNPTQTKGRLIGADPAPKLTCYRRHKKAHASAAARNPVTAIGTGPYVGNLNMRLGPLWPRPPIIHGNSSNFGQKFSSCVAEGANNGATADRRVASRTTIVSKIAADLLVVINKTSARRASDRAEIKRQFPEVYRECHAIADLADQWLRSGQIPTADRMGDVDATPARHFRNQRLVG